MDDETYVQEDFKQIPESQYYTAHLTGGVKKKFKCKKVDKFEKENLSVASILQLCKIH